MTIFRNLLRRKNLHCDGRTSLSRCLNALDLTALGIGSTIGSGIYVVTGQVAKSVAGPSVILSFVVAAFASVLAGLCYAEFGARVPKTGSAYVYSYVTVGELWAFIIGWNLILEYVIGTAGVARGLSAFIDSISGKVMSQYLKEYLPISVYMLSPYPDFLSLAFTIVLTIILCFGVKESSFLNNIFTLVNVAVVAYVIICGCFKSDYTNWQLPGHWENKTNVTDAGGFFPYGISGMLSGSATCFFAFVGFDVIATTGEEVINPQKAIPLSIILCLFVCAVGYIGISSVLTLIVPYYLLDDDTPLSSAFGQIGWKVAEYIIAIGAICSLITCLLTSMFPLPRIILAMSRDGLLFRFLAKVNRRFKTPILATVISGVFAGVMAMMFELKELVDMMSIGTLLAYTLVAACVLLLRYEESVAIETSIQDEADVSTSVFRCFGGNAEPTQFSSRVVKVAVSCASLCTIWFGLVEIKLIKYIGHGTWWALLLLLLPIVLLLTCGFVIWSQPQNITRLPFTVPFVPLLPLLSIVLNIYLMLKLSQPTWIRFAVWMIVGFAIYGGYGIWHSNDDPEIGEDEDTNGDTETENTPRNNSISEASRLLPFHSARL